MMITPAFAPAGGTWQPEAAIDAIAAAWEGSWSNHRQVVANQQRGGPAAPELTQERREMRVVRLDAPQLGETVLFFEETRQSSPGLAHRQRVVSLVAAEQPPDRDGAALVIARQLFFQAGPTYDRPPLRAADVAELSAAEFRREPGCDLLFSWEAQLQRWRGSMRPCACQYHHPSSGLVYAEFAMLLLPDQLWYRDRSLKLPDHSIRGEVDGFSWLLFDRQHAEPAAPPAAAVAPSIEALVEPGVYAGSFRRYDADGQLIEQFPAEIVVRLHRHNERILYHQTNLYRPVDAPAQRLDSHGEIRNGRLSFSNERLRGWSLPVQATSGYRAAVLMMEFIDGSGLSLHELVVISADGQQRSRVAQIMRDGRVVRRTMIDEVKQSGDWQAWDLAHDSPSPSSP